jgi:hypothetical protein
MAGLFREKSIAGWLLMTGLFRDKNTAGWWLINQANSTPRNAAGEGGLTAMTTCNACRIREIDFSWLLEVAFSVVGVGLTALLAVGGKSVGDINDAPRKSVHLSGRLLTLQRLW